MGGEGIAPVRWEGEARRSAMQVAAPDAPGQRAGGLPRGAAGEAGLAAGQQADFRNRCALCDGRSRPFRGRDRAKRLTSRDFGGGADVEVEFHVNTLFTLNCCGAALIRVPPI